ncbi:hypothetical protein, partial [Shewanella atlantica]
MKNTRYTHIFSAVMLASVITACESDDAGTPVQSAPEVILDVSNGLQPVSSDVPTFIDLSPFISAKGDYTLVGVKQIKNQGTGSCQHSAPEGSGFTATLGGGAACHYQYDVKSTNSSAAVATGEVVVVVSVPGDPVMKPISVAMQQDETVVIDLDDELSPDYPSGYVLSGEISDITLLGDGQVTDVNEVANTITYVSAGTQGYTRLIYTLEGLVGGEPDMKIGNIDISVSDNLNHAPSAENWHYSDMVDTETTVTMDVAPFISDSDTYNGGGVDTV